MNFLKVRVLQRVLRKVIYHESNQNFLVTAGLISAITISIKNSTHAKIHLEKKTVEPWIRLMTVQGIRKLLLGLIHLDMETPLFQYQNARNLPTRSQLTAWHMLEKVDWIRNLPSWSLIPKPHSPNSTNSRTFLKRHFFQSYMFPKFICVFFHKGLNQRKLLTSTCELHSKIYQFVPSNIFLRLKKLSDSILQLIYSAPRLWLPLQRIRREKENCKRCSVWKFNHFDPSSHFLLLRKKPKNAFTFDLSRFSESEFCVTTGLLSFMVLWIEKLLLLSTLSEKIQLSGYCIKFLVVREIHKLQIKMSVLVIQTLISA